MFRDHLDKIGGIEIYPLISLVIFFVFFLALLTWLFKSKKSEMDALSRIPLEEDTTIKNPLIK